MLTSEIVEALPVSLGKRIQLGFAVKNLDEALKFWTENFKVGPFILIGESLGERKFVHRGRVSDVQMSVALSYFGDVQIELISISNSAPSPYKEFFDGGQEGLHHLAFCPEDYETACHDLERLGFEEVCSIQMPDGTKNVSYYQGPAHLGVQIELVPFTELRKNYYEHIKRLTETWNGEDPVRRYPTRAQFMQSSGLNK